MKIIRLSLIIGLLALMAAGAASAYTYPTVTFNFVPTTFAYVYTVTVTPSDDFPLGYVELDTLVKNAGLTAWTMLGPTASGVDLDWSKTSFEWAENCDAANWYADKGKGQQAIYPSNWVGVFTLIAPNTKPADGFGLTMSGSESSDNSFTITVPGPTVPEPSSMMAMAGGLLGIGGMLFRRRKTR